MKAPKPSTPWNSIAESLVPVVRAQPYNYAEAIQSPCMRCSTSPCCTHLPLHTFQITNLVEFDHARYLLNFHRIELALSASGDWSAYYTFPCRFLDRSEFTCTLHNQAAQPRICANYNPYQCWYKRVLTQSMTDDFVRIDRQRMDLLTSLLGFDEAGTLTQIPDWEQIQNLIRELPMEKGPVLPEPALQDPILQQWEQQLTQASPPPQTSPQSAQELVSPCSTCQAYCCTTLVFPQSTPTAFHSFDYFRFCLGFPGVEIGISDQGWSLIVKTSCRHLKDQQCQVFGQPERPLLCKYYDEWKCSYKPQFGLPRPAGFVRVSLDQFPYLLGSFGFTPEGGISHFPGVEEMRHLIEVQWAAAKEQSTEAP